MGPSPTSATIVDGAIFTEEDRRSREQIYEDYIAQIMKAQGCSRGKAKRVLNAIQKKQVKKYLQAHSKQVMAAQKRRDLGIADPAPVTPLDEILNDVTDENIHEEVLTGEPTGQEVI